MTPGEVVAQSHRHELIRIVGGLEFRRKGEKEPLFTVSHGSHACDLSPQATRSDLASLVFFLAGRLLDLERGKE